MCYSTALPVVTGEPCHCNGKSIVRRGEPASVCKHNVPPFGPVTIRNCFAGRFRHVFSVDCVTHFINRFPFGCQCRQYSVCTACCQMVGLTGFEPAASFLSGKHSYQTELQPIVKW